MRKLTVFISEDLSERLSSHISKVFRGRRVMGAVVEKAIAEYLEREERRKEVEESART